MAPRQRRAAVIPPDRLTTTTLRAEDYLVESVQITVVCVYDKTHTKVLTAKEATEMPLCEHDGGPMIAAKAEVGRETVWPRPGGKRRSKRKARR